MNSSIPKKQSVARILLLQFRDDATIKQTEYDSFVEYLGLTPEQVVSHDVLAEAPQTDILSGFDAVVVAGNGSESSNDDTSYKRAVLELLRFTYDNDIPTFAVCYGAQFAALAFGGKVERVEEMRETGTYPMYLTPEAANDPLFKEMNTPFNGQMGHNDSITELPEGVVRLSYSDRVPNQAFRFKGKPFYAVQFHPELGEEEIRSRFHYYKDYYADDMEEFNAILDNIQESTDASKLLKLFVDRIVLEPMAEQKPAGIGVKCSCAESVHSAVCAVS